MDIVTEDELTVLAGDPKGIGGASGRIGGSGLCGRDGRESEDEDSAERGGCSVPWRL
ncbi:hypothetical protein [Streptomyces sp. NPDC002785]|uniref:hypothetical protein n=1 Tax=Streptomyces sp. NPDC002785 TaxID=3154543 RepID=UPI00331EF0FF